MELRIRPKSDYLHQASWEDLYFLTAHWKSEMEFFKDELHFLSDLIQKHFLFLIMNDAQNNIPATSYKLYNVKRETALILKKLEAHLIHLEELMENAFSHDEQEFREEHDALEKRIMEYIQLFKEVKKEIFSISKQAIKNKKLKQVLSYQN